METLKTAPRPSGDVVFAILERMERARAPGGGGDDDVGQGNDVTPDSRVDGRRGQKKLARNVSCFTLNAFAPRWPNSCGKEELPSCSSLPKIVREVERRDCSGCT